MRGAGVGNELCVWGGWAVQRARGAGIECVRDADGASDDACDDAAHPCRVTVLCREATGVEVQGHAIPKGQDDDRDPIEEDRVRYGFIAVCIGNPFAVRCLVANRVGGGDSGVVGHAVLDPSRGDDEAGPSNGTLHDVGVGHRQQATRAGIYPDEEGGNHDPGVLIHAEQEGYNLPATHQVPGQQEGKRDERHKGAHNFCTLAVETGEGIGEGEQVHLIHWFGEEDTHHDQGQRQTQRQGRAIPEVVFVREVQVPQRSTRIQALHSESGHKNPRRQVPASDEVVTRVAPHLEECDHSDDQTDAHEDDDRDALPHEVSDLHREVDRARDPTLQPLQSRIGL
mmetsp:Transcript_5070/g.12367  ORF Transcript_5070/g.12367 Transcript_5070/m.12367 type:complete len:340 (-) Transcript_5070:23-1042(-)